MLDEGQKQVLFVFESPQSQELGSVITLRNMDSCFLHGEVNIGSSIVSAFLLLLLPLISFQSYSLLEMVCSYIFLLKMGACHCG